MGDLRCARCELLGMYWRNLGTLNEHTYCPHCGGINYQEDMPEPDETDPNGAPPPDDNKAGREHEQMKKEGTK